MMMHPAIILLMLSDISNKNFPDITKSFDYINQTFNSSVYNNAKDEIITYVFSLVFAEMLNTYFNTPLSWQNILTKLLDYKIKDENVFKEYIKHSLISGIKHLNFALHGPANKKGSQGFKTLEDLRSP